MSVSLPADAASAFLATARSLLRLSRPGQQYPNARAIDAFLEALARRAEAGGPVALDPRSGLPTLAELAAIRGDRLVAPEFLRDHASRLTARSSYFSWLSTVEIPAASQTAASLVARLPDGGARLRVVHDTLDPAHGAWVRLTAQLTQHHDNLVRFEREDLCVPQPALEEALERCAGADAELALLLLAQVRGVAVEEVVRGQLGPLHSRFVPPPEPLASLMGDGPDALLHLVVERAAHDVAQDACRDPLSRLYRDSLPPGARAAAEARRAELGYRVSKERRLICTPALEPRLKRWAADGKHAVVVRSR